MWQISLVDEINNILFEIYTLYHGKSVVLKISLTKTNSDVTVKISYKKI